MPIILPNTPPHSPYFCWYPFVSCALSFVVLNSRRRYLAIESNTPVGCIRTTKCYYVYFCWIIFTPFRCIFLSSPHKLMHCYWIKSHVQLLIIWISVWGDQFFMAGCSLLLSDRSVSLPTCTCFRFICRGIICRNLCGFGHGSRWAWLGAVYWMTLVCIFLGFFQVSCHFLKSHYCTVNWYLKISHISNLHPYADTQTNFYIIPFPSASLLHPSFFPISGWFC